MPRPDLLLAFLATAALFSFIPGPAMLYTAARTLGGGRRAGFMAALGLHIGGYAHVAAAAAGLTLLFQAVPTLYLAVKLAGALYLVWLGIGLIRARDPAAATDLGGEQPGGWRAFAQSVSVEILNPKTALFFLALLPQFVDRAATAPVWLQLAGLGTVVNVMFSLSDIACVLLAGLVMRGLRGSARGRRVMQRAGGSILVGLGAHLALTRS